MGGCHIKATIVNEDGKLMMDYQSIETPHPATFLAIMSAIESLAKSFPGFDRISVGFPGYVKDGIVITAPNLDQKTWAQVNLNEQLNTLLGKPARVINDADMLALGVVSGKGLEMLITLGTGFGTALLKDGILLPHLEFSHHVVGKYKSYDAYIGASAFQSVGVKKWISSQAELNFTIFLLIVSSKHILYFTPNPATMSKIAFFKRPHDP